MNKKVYKVPIQITKLGLTIEAFGLCSWLLSLPAKEKLNISDMAKATGITRATLYVYLRELEKLNVLKPSRLGRGVVYGFTSPETWGQIERLTTIKESIENGS